MYHFASYARCTRSVSIGKLPSFEGSLSKFYCLLWWKKNPTALSPYWIHIFFHCFIAVPPAYYAHLAAFRARFYMDPESSDSGSMASGRGPPSGSTASRGTRAPGSAAVKPLPALKDSVKNVMFYCWSPWRPSLICSLCWCVASCHCNYVKRVVIMRQLPSRAAYYAGLCLLKYHLCVYFIML